ncbi:polyphosphate polymerase domain-containing protein [Candidatus Saccharibacteria bacterium]|nr:polyphosphate polymerase domain-containing protein [Candidatus Saccharibacteria bacterium]
MVTKQLVIKKSRPTQETPIQEVFRREEVKYCLTPEKADLLLQEIAPHIKPDKYPTGTNSSIYFDTRDGYLALHSLEKPLYKEKIRIRSYSCPTTLDSTIFIEIKKKFDGIGNKRRIAVKLRDFYTYLETGSLITENPQIRRELDYCFKFYNLIPYLYLAYDRHSYAGAAPEDSTFRLTFDRNIRYRTTNLRLETPGKDTLYFNNGEIIMEAKALDAYPLWFTRALSKLKIYPVSFSKYGKVCQKLYYHQQG